MGAQTSSIEPHTEALLNQQLKRFNKKEFIEKDPISIPHAFLQQQDVEIAAFFAALFAWGNRTTIIQKCNDLMQRMDRAPHAFVVGHQPKDLKKLIDFKHRTFNATDLLHLVRFLHHHYSSNASLETAFTRGMKKSDETVEGALIHFHRYCFSLEDSPPRSRKHISTPESGSSCKRLNMFLRWMVRRDKAGIDFGIWKGIRSNQLVCPLDIHVQRMAFQLGLITVQKSDWKTAVALTERLKVLDDRDPVKYDIALFSMGANPV